MTTTKIKKYLYYNNQTKRYRINYGTTVTTKDKKTIMHIYKQLEEINWIPSKAIPLLAKYKQSNTHRKLITTCKGHTGRVLLYFKGFYIQSGTIQEIKQTIQEYIKTGYDDKFIDKKRANKNYNKTKNIPRYILYIPSIKKYRILKNKEGLTKYYGTYETLPEAEKALEKIIENNWEHTYTRGPYNKNPKDRYIQKQTHGDHYAIIKQGQHYGTFRTLEDAREERDWLVENNWDYDNLDLY